MRFTLQQLREDLHQIPETSYTEYKTQEYLLNTLQEFGYQPQKIADTGLVVFIDNNQSETIAFRSDIDALPVQEETGVSFVSKHPGKMHACGHDGHMSMLLGLADYLADKRHLLQQNVLLIFQPAEESIGGAKRIVETGIFKKHNVTSVYGIHLYPELEEGTIGSKPGEFMAMVNEITITVHGKSSHGAMPQNGIDANLILGKLLIDFQTIQTRMISPLQQTIITFGKITGGTVRNQISDKAVMEGTIRSFHPTIQQQIKESIHQFTKHYEIMYGCTIDVEIRDGYLPVVNDLTLFNHLKEALQDQPFYEFPNPLMIAEDFSFYQQAAPGVFFFVGTRNEKLGYTYSLHHSKFNFTEHALQVGLEAYKTVLYKRGVLDE